MTCEDTLNVTSSPAAVSGRLPRGSPDGPMTDLFGRDHAHAKGKASPAKGSEPMIQGICGRTFIESSVPDGPLSSWENRLRLRLGRIGSTESALIWRTKTTPCGRSISRLAPSTLHTNGNESTGSLWITASARDGKDSAGMAQVAKDGRVRIDQLPRQMISYSPTPTVADVQGGRKARSGDRSNEPLLNGLLAAYSATPRASDGEKGGPNMSFGAGGTPLPAQMHAMGYAPTPTSLSFKDSHQPGNSRSLNLMRQHFAMDRGGPTTNGLSVPSTAKRGAPNPEFPFWLMGFPVEWICGALAAMPSFLNSRRKSSRRSKKA